MKILATAAAEFIGLHTSLRLRDRGDEVIGVGNLNDYCDVSLKEARRARLAPSPKFKLRRITLENRKAKAALFRAENHLAACGRALCAHKPARGHRRAPAGIHGHPGAFTPQRRRAPRVLQQFQRVRRQHENALLGARQGRPPGEHKHRDQESQRAEAAYKHPPLRLPKTNPLFLTIIYGPSRRPDIDLSCSQTRCWKAKLMLEGGPIDMFDNGQMVRDYTYMNDVVEGIAPVCDKPVTASDKFHAVNPDPAPRNVPHRLFNIGNSQPTPLMDCINTLGKAMGQAAKKRFLAKQPEDVPAINPGPTELQRGVNFAPRTSVEGGVRRVLCVVCGSLRNLLVSTPGPFSRQMCTRTVPNGRRIVST